MGVRRMRKFKTVLEYKEINIERTLDQCQEVLFCITFRQVYLMKGQDTGTCLGDLVQTSVLMSHYQGHLVFGVVTNNTF